MLADAAEAAGVRRYLMISAMGTDRADPDSDDVFQVYLRAKQAADDYLRSSDLDWTIVKPGRLTDDVPTGQVQVGKLERGSVTRGDVAHVLAEVLEAENTIGKTFDVLNGDVAGRRGDRQALARLSSATTLTSFGARTITLRTCLPSSARCTASSARAAASRSASLMSGETSRRARSLPCTWTIAVTESSTSSASSTTGQPARATVGSWPSRSHISSAVYGATSDSRMATASAASRTAGSAGPQPESIALRVAFTSSIVRATITLNRCDSTSSAASCTRVVGDLAQRQVAAVAARCPAPR